MLNNHNKNEKTKNQLVFKLLKTMNPYIPNVSQSSTIKDQLYSIIQSQTNTIIRQQTQQQYEDDQNQYQQNNNYATRNGNSKIVGNIASRVVNVMVANGVWMDQGRVKNQFQRIIERQLQAQRQSKIVRNQIQQIQDNAYKKFKIKKQSNMRNNNYNTGSYSSYSSLSARQPIASISSQSQLYKYTNLQTQRNFNGYNSQIKTQRNTNYNSHISNNYRYQNNGTRQSNSNLYGITDRFSTLRLSLSQLQSPVKTYRHQLDAQIQAYKSQLKPNNIYDQSDLGLQSKISDKSTNYEKDKKYKQSKLIKSRSQLTIKNKPSHQQFVDHRMRSNSSNHNKSNKSKLNIKWANTEVDKNQSFEKYDLNKKVSQKLLKQSNKLDVQVMASLLHKKMRQNDKSNTIASLIKGK